jgi:hypothetical protein
MTVQPPTPPSVNRTAGRTIAALTAALGVAVIVGTVWSGVVPTVASALTRTETHELAVDGVRELSLDVAAATFSVRFESVDEASLELTEVGAGDWTFEVDGDTLRVSSPDRLWGWMLSNARDGRAVLTLPRELEGVDADVTFGAGAFDADGDFGELGLDMGAGQASLLGSADTVSVEIGAGRADVDLEGVRAAEFELNAGRLSGRLTGTAPETVDISANAGALDLELPDTTYLVTSEVSAGSLDDALPSDPSSPRRVHVEVSAGSVSLQPAS